MRKVPFALNLFDHQILQPQTSITPLASSASPSKLEISYSVREGSPNRSGGSAGQMRMCVVSVTLPPSSLLSWWIWRPLIDPSSGMPSPPPSSKCRKDLPYLRVNMRCYLKEHCPEFRRKCFNIGPSHGFISEPISVISQFWHSYEHADCHNLCRMFLVASRSSTTNTSLLYRFVL